LTRVKGVNTDTHSSQCQHVNTEEKGANSDKRSSLLQQGNNGQVEKDLKFRSSDSISVSHRRNLSVSIHFNLESYFSQDITNEQI